MLTILPLLRSICRIRVTDYNSYAVSVRISPCIKVNQIALPNAVFFGVRERLRWLVNTKGDFEVEGNHRGGFGPMNPSRTSMLSVASVSQLRTDYRSNRGCQVAEIRWTPCYLLPMSGATTPAITDAAQRIRSLSRRVAKAFALANDSFQVSGAYSKIAGHVADANAHDPGFRSFMKVLALPEKFRKICEDVANRVVESTDVSINAATIMIAHSTADDVFTEVCKISIRLDPIKKS
jgi:hypothetical protein